jgi:hypothetical protein
MSQAELRASFDAWLHAECGLTFQDVAEYSPQELARLQLGYMVREQPQQQVGGPASGTRLASRKRDLQRGQQQARQEMFDEFGIHS